MVMNFDNVKTINLNQNFIENTKSIFKMTEKDRVSRTFIKYSERIAIKI